MNKTKNIDLFIKDCAISADEETKEKFVGWESLIAILIYQGIRLMLPEIKEWFKLGAQANALKRQEIKKKLVNYALEKELDFPQAEQAAEIISQRLDEKTLKDIIEVFEK
ncbi:MAG: hypothetical protein ACMUIU_02995 [bacterium]